MTNTQFFDHMAEQSVLEALYLDADKIYQTHLKAEDFHREDYRNVFLAMLKCYSDGLAFDLKTLKDNGAPISAAVSIASSAFTSANFNYHERIVLSRSFARKSQSKMNDLMKYIGDDDFLIRIETMITELQEISAVQAEKSIKQVLCDIHTSIIEARQTSYSGVQTGFSKLNDYCVGMYPRHFWILGGLTSQGKSTVMSQILRDTCSNKAGVLVFSVEDSRQDKMNRLIATVSDVPITHIVRGTIKDYQFLRAIEEIAEYNLHIYDDVYTIPEIDMKIKKHKMRGKLDLVAVDFVQNMVTGGESIYDRMSEVAINLQKLAKKHNVCVFALSQMTGDKMRGAQELESAADIVLWIDREYGEKEFNLVIKKNRPFGKTGKIPFTFNETWTRIREN